MPRARKLSPTEQSSAPSELADGVRISRAEQAELHAEAIFLGPAHDGRQAHAFARTVRGELDGKLLAESHDRLREHEHAADAEVFRARCEGAAVSTATNQIGLNGSARVTTFFDHAFVRTLRVRARQRSSVLISHEPKVRHGR